MVSKRKDTPGNDKYLVDTLLMYFSFNSVIIGFIQRYMHAGCERLMRY